MAVDTAPRTDVVERVPTGLYIGGEWRDATGGGTLPVEDPGTGETLAHIRAFAQQVLEVPATSSAR